MTKQTPNQKIANFRNVKKRQKENLKVLVENSNVSKLRSTSRIIKYGASSFRRNVWLSIAATLVMTITLIILLITIGASMILSATADTMRQKIDITVFFQPGTPESALEQMADTMRLDNNVVQVDVADSLTEYENFLTENQDNTDLLTALADDDMRQMMLDTMQATMRIKVHNPDDLTSIRYIVDHDVMFQDNLDSSKDPTYDVNQAEIATISSWATIAKNGGLILGAVFLVISVLVIFNTIRMAIFSRREEVHMMKLVGADREFIQGPFQVEAQICGIISGLLAATTVYIGFQFIAPGLNSYGIDISLVASFMTTSRLVYVYLGTVAVGILVGTISARLAIQKYLK